MQRESGTPSFPLWLLGDSNPPNWAHLLLTPLDPRHPARHNIWTPVLDTMQDVLYRAARLRINTADLYIQNAIADPGSKPATTATTWPDAVTQDVQTYATAIVVTTRPTIIFSFGAFAFEFARRAIEPSYHPRGYGCWGARTLGEEFIQRIEHFSPETTNVLPLLHATIARRWFLESHAYFTRDTTANYFTFTGERIASVLLKYRDQLPIWIA